MKQLIVFIIMVFAFVCNGQTPQRDFDDINSKDVFEIKGLVYLKADSTFANGRIIRYNRKNEAKRYMIVSNGKPEGLRWIKLDNRKVFEPKENPLVTLLVYPIIASYAKKAYGNDVQGNDIGFNFKNFVPQITITESNYIHYNKRKSQNAYRDMTFRNDISKELNIDKKISIETVEENDEHDQLKIEENDIDLKNNGVWKKHYPNGKLKSKGFYLEGKKDGVWEEYYENGQLIYMGSYIKGIKNGPWEEYYLNGQLKKKGSYFNGKYIDQWIHFKDSSKLHLIENVN